MPRVAGRAGRRAARAAPAGGCARRTGSSTAATPAPRCGCSRACSRRSRSRPRSAARRLAPPPLRSTASSRRCARWAPRCRAADGDRLPPLVVRGGPLRGHHASRADTQRPGRQRDSARRRAGPRRDHGRDVLGRARPHRRACCGDFGVPVEAAAGGRRRHADRRVEGPARLRGCSVRVPGRLLGGGVLPRGSGRLPGRPGHGGRRGAERDPHRTARPAVADGSGRARGRRSATADGEPVGDVTVTGAEELRPGDIPPVQVVRLLDEIPAWAVAASAARGTSRLRGAAELRVKESDRLHALAEGLRGLGVQVEEFPDGLDIHGGPVARRPRARATATIASRWRSRCSAPAPRARSPWTTRPASPRRTRASARRCARWVAGSMGPGPAGRRHELRRHHRRSLGRRQEHGRARGGDASRAPVRRHRRPVPGARAEAPAAGRLAGPAGRGRADAREHASWTSRARPSSRTSGWTART